MATPSPSTQTINTDAQPPSNPSTSSADRDLSFTERLFITYGYMIVGIFLSWFFGFIGVPYIFTVIVIYIVWKVYEKTRDPLIRETLKQINLTKLQRTNQMRLEAGVNVAESAEWLNTLLNRIWPKLGPQVLATARQQVQAQMFGKFKDKVPPFVQNVIIKRIDMGTISPELTSVQFNTKSKYVYMLDTVLDYEGDMIIELEIVLGGPWGQFRIPVVAKQVEVIAKSCVRFDMDSTMPFVHTVTCSIQECIVDLSIKIYNTIDIMNIPLLNSYALDIVTRSLKANPIIVDLVDQTTKAERQRVHEELLRKEKANRKLRTGAKITAAQVAPDHIGFLSVKIIEATDLLAKDFGGGASDPYCRIRFGSKMVETAVVKDNCSPKWNDLKQFSVGKMDERKLTIQIFDWNQVTAHEFLGMAEVDFANLKDNEKRDLWIPLHDQNNLSGTNRGLLHIEISFFLDFDQ